MCKQVYSLDCSIIYTDVTVIFCLNYTEHVCIHFSLSCCEVRFSSLVEYSLWEIFDVFDMV